MPAPWDTLCKHPRYKNRDKDDKRGLSGNTATEESIRGWSAVWLALVHPVTGMGEEATMKEGVHYRHLCACVWGHDAHVGARGQPVGISALLLPLGPRDKTQAFSLITCRVVSSAPSWISKMN